MNKIFDINYPKLLRLLLPTILRKRTILAFLAPIFSAVNKLNQSFKLNRDTNLYNMQITPQICYLKKMLNDRYDIDNRDIYIKDSYSDYKQATFVYPEEAGKRLPLYTEIENYPIYLYDKSEMATSGIDFIVCVPNSVVFDMNEMTALINTYRLTSKQFSIIKY